MINYTIYIDKNNSISRQFEPSTLLSSVRSALAGIMNSNHRFLNYQNASTAYYPDLIVAKSAEGFVPISSILGMMNQVYITDVTQTQNVDMIGFKTPWFWDRQLGFKVSMNNESAAQSSNAGKMPPLMLTNVKLSNPNIRGAGSMDNVLVCQKDTIISFALNSWGAAAYGYDVRPQAGTPITGSPLYICFSSCSPNNRVIGGLQKYYSQTDANINGKMIKVVPTSSLVLSNGTTLPYMKFSVKSWIVTSYKPGSGSAFTCNMPIPSSSVGGRAVSPGTTVPTTTPSGQVFNGPIGNIVENKGPTGIIGEIVFYAFVFNSNAEAQAAFGGVNSPNNSIWVV